MPVDALTVTVATWPLSSVLPPLDAFAAAPAAVRAHVRVILSAWGMGEFEETASLGERACHERTAGVHRMRRPANVPGWADAGHAVLHVHGRGAAASRSLGPGSR